MPAVCVLFNVLDAASHAEGSPKVRKIVWPR